MNRLLLAVLAVAMAGFAFTSFVALSVIGLIGWATFAIVNGVRGLLPALQPVPQPAYARSCCRTRRSDGINRVWDDGRGTIIDM